MNLKFNEDWFVGELNIKNYYKVVKLDVYFFCISGCLSLNLQSLVSVLQIIQFIKIKQQLHSKLEVMYPCMDFWMQIFGQINKQINKKLLELLIN